MSKMDLHDRTFSYCMTDLRAARQFFVQYLPKFRVLLGYVFQTTSTQQYDKILEVLQTMSDKVGGVSMTIAQMLRKEGRQEGKLLMAQEMAQRMLKEGIELSVVARITGLSVEELAQYSH